MTPESRQSVEEVGRALLDVGRALVVSSHMINRAQVDELLAHVRASLAFLDVRLREEPED